MALAATYLTAAICLLGQSSPLDELDVPDRHPEPGLFARILSTENFIGPGVRSTLQASVKPAACGKPLCLSADFESQKSLVLVADKLARDFPRELVEIVTATRNRVELIGLVSDEEGRDRVRGLLAEHGLTADSIRVLQLPCETKWVRDFGPVFVRSGDSRLLAFDFDYMRRSGDVDRRLDDLAATELARQLDIPVRGVPLEIEQGDLLSNGRGLLVTTTRLFNNNISHGFNVEAIERSLQAMFGCETIVVLEPLRREPTGHVDLLACFTDPQTIVIGEYQGSDDPENVRLLHRNAELLSSVLVSGAPLRVVRLPLPVNGDDVWCTYTNVVFANGTLLVPQYEDIDANADALATFRRLLPEWTITGINTSELMAEEGALRCITLSVPAVGAGDDGE